MSLSRFNRIAIFTLALSLMSGCTNALQSGHNTALTGMDLKSMTDKMAASLAASPAVRQAIREKGELKIVVEPAQNEMEAEVLPHGQAEAFTARVRLLLSGHNQGRFLWILNRDEFYDLRNSEIADTLGPAPGAIDPEYALVARFRSLTSENAKLRTSSYLCVYELTNLKDRTVLWNDKYEVRKKAVKGFLD
ncbi:MAG TPA: hypothetical protein VFC78_04795 [Tepidisphaeraceae bacterium]|nr:hypothetical protein [Tepidisphaeraceae bacterium]